MEIVQNKALLLGTRNPDKITQVIQKAKVVGEANGISRVLVHWDLPNAFILRNLGFKKIPSTILKDYEWPGLYTPFEHQKDTASFLTLHRKAFCFNEQGTGKTNSVIWASDYLMKIGVIRRVLIICPLSIMDCAWRSDLFKTVMHRRVGIAHGSREKRLEVIKSNAEYVIINPDGVEIIQNELARGKFDLVVCDEATFLKNPKTRRWKAINTLVGPDTWLWLLTGTPAAQSPEDAYGLAKLINPSSVPSYGGAWKDKVMLKIGQFKWVPRPESQEIVHNVLQPAVRYSKEECLDLPEMLYSTREVEMTTQQKKYYDKLRKEMLIQAAGEEVSAVNAAVQMNKLLQISGGSVYADTGEIIEFDVSHKLSALLETIEESSHKTLVFCTYQHSIDLVQRFLTGHKISSEVIHGGISAKKRTLIFEQFQKAKDPQVLIIQPQAAAHGVTLTAANTVCWFSPTTSAESYLQANARVHRQGQRNPCLVVHLCSSPVEKKLYKALEERTLAQGDLLGMFKNFLGGEL